MAAKIRLGLEALRAACEVLGNPQLAAPTVLIAGTNGKGSTASMLESIARAAGLKVGLFHSPALGGEHEHIRLEGAPLDSRIYGALVEDVTRTTANLEEALTPFEITTAVAYLAFAREALDLAIVEVGLGGARDATNVADPAVSVLTTVDFDHQAFLGTTLTDIATEKAGIFRPRRPAILGYLSQPALQAARQVAESIGARPISAQHSVQGLSVDDGWLSAKTARAEYRLQLPLAGEHQGRNAAVAILAAESLRARFPSIDHGAIVRGLERVRCPGRLERLSNDSGEYWLDAAHNEAAARALATHLSGLPRRPDLLFGAFADKDARGMLELLRPQVERLILTPIEHPRSWRPAAVAPAFGAEVVASPEAGLAAIRPHIPLLVAGSVRLIGDVRHMILKNVTRHAVTG